MHESTFSFLLLKVSPLFLTIVLGYVAGRFAKVKKEPIAHLLIYILAPIVTFHGGFRSGLTLRTALLPAVFFIVPSLLSLAVYHGGRLFGEERRKLLSFTVGDGNTGYFGIPIMTAIFGDQVVPLLVVCILGLTLYEFSVCFFFAARGRYSVRESLLTMVKLPVLYSFLAGVLLNQLGFHEPVVYAESISRFISAYSVLGMLLLGISMAGVTRAEFDGVFMAILMGCRFLVWPLLMAAFIQLDAALFHALLPEMRPQIFVYSFVPLAANSVAFAAEFELSPGTVALTVVVSTLVSLMLMPFVAAILLAG